MTTSAARAAALPDVTMGEVAKASAALLVGVKVSVGCVVQVPPVVEAGDGGNTE